MPHSSTTARRAVIALTAAALSGSALVAGAGPASAAPQDPDLTGLVTNTAGAGIAGVYAYAYTTPADGSEPEYVGSAQTDATGRYTFTDLDPASLAGEEPAIATETDFKLFFSWFPQTPAEVHTTGYLDRGLGGTKTVRAAGSVVVPANAQATAPTQALPNAGGVLLRVVGPTGAPVTGTGSGSVVDLDAYDPTQSGITGGNTSDDDYFYPDTDGDGDPNAPIDGLVYIDGIEPGSSYGVSAGGSDFNTTTGVTTSFVSRFFGGNGSFTEAKPVTVKAGAFTPVTVQLSDKLTSYERPRILGNSSFGSKLKADPGEWLNQRYADFSYQWLRGSKLVGTDDTYKVSKKDKGKKIKLVVTAVTESFLGSAVAAPTSKVGEKSKVTVTKKNADGSLAVKVVVAKSKLAKKLGTPKGKVQLVTEDGSTASKKVKLKGGQATLKPRAKFAGEKLTVVYLGGGKLGSDTVSAGGKGGKKKK